MSPRAAGTPAGFQSWSSRATSQSENGEGRASGAMRTMRTWSADCANCAISVKSSALSQTKPWNEPRPGQLDSPVARGVPDRRVRARSVWPRRSPMR